MATEWSKATPELLDIATELIDLYHPHLQDASIGFLFRSEAPKSNGHVTLGKAKKISADMNMFMDYDFVIWVALDWWDRLKPGQKVALVDHELHHCWMDAEGKPSMRPHDVEEFNAIIERHGFWWPTAEETMQAIQGSLLPVERTKRGRVEAVSNLAEFA